MTLQQYVNVFIYLQQL